jgi:hypothetical protein
MVQDERPDNMVSIPDGAEKLELYFLKRTGIVQSVYNGLAGRGSILSREEFFCTPQRPERLWDPPNLLSYPRG